MYNPGGMERILTEKINFLIENYNYEVILVTTDQKNKSFFYQLSSKVKVLDFELNFDEDYNKSFISKYISIKKKLKIYKSKLEKIINSENVQVCISTGGKELEFLYSLNVKCKKILEIHFSKKFREQFLIARNNNYINRIVGKIRTIQLINQTRSLDAVVVLTKKDKIDWKRTHKNIYHIYNFSSIVPLQKASLNVNRAIAVGKLDSQKGFDMLIDAWALEKDNLKNWELDIYGQGEWELLLKEKIKFYDLGDSINLRGVTKNIETEFLNSSLFLFPSRYEGFSLVFIEAMNCGLPIVSFDCPEGPSELILENDIGFLVPANNLIKFSESMVRLTKDEKLRERMGKKSFEKSKNFSKENIMKMWDNLFRNLLINSMKDVSEK